ncbi:MAG: hypothetical protein HZA28_09255 [Candidatus Omnitrophica bacterium]|nr:hypothetical protein [Candidatus Omnitrophota bacterium]
MKRVLGVVCAVVCLFNVAAYAEESSLMDLRNKILVESQGIKAWLPDTKDAVLVSSLWDSCVLTISQLDAYFSQLGIFNTIKKEDVTPAAVEFLEKWLQGIKNTNDVNIKSLAAVSQPLQAKTKLHVERLSGYFADLNKEIDKELAKVAALKK